MMTDRKPNIHVQINHVGKPKAELFTSDEAPFIALSVDSSITTCRAYYGGKFYAEIEGESRNGYAVNYLSLDQARAVIATGTGHLVRDLEQLPEFARKDYQPCPADTQAGRATGARQERRNVHRRAPEPEQVGHMGSSGGEAQGTPEG